jgi:hypothetical protein
VILVCGSCTEREKASVDPATGGHSPKGRERERADGGNRKALSTDAALAGGPARSSHEAAACWGGGGAKGPAHHEGPFRTTGLAREEAKMNTPKPQDKPFVIPKSTVWEAYRRVAANKGAPSVPRGLLRLSAGTLATGRACGMPAAVLEVRLGHRLGCPEVLGAIVTLPPRCCGWCQRGCIRPVGRGFVGLFDVRCARG